MALPDFRPTVPVLARTLAEHWGDKILLTLGDQRLSFAEADAQSRPLARGLLADGVGKGSHVGLLMPNGPDWVLAWLAAARIGATLVPINTFFQTRELDWILRHADVDTLLVSARFLNHDYLARLEDAAPGLAEQGGAPLVLASHPLLRRVYVWGESDRKWSCDGPKGLAARAAAHPAIDEAFLLEAEACVTPADSMALIYSSGSTADPKGALHTHAGLIRHAINLNRFRDLGPEDRMYSPMPFFWVGGFVFVLLSGMTAGAKLLCEEVFEPGATLEMLERERATVVAGWPHYAKAMAEHPSFPDRDLGSVRGGNLYEVLPESARPKDPELRSNSLGMTETAGPHTIGRMDQDLPETLRGSFGQAVPGMEHKLVDPESGARLAPGETGEICVRGYSLMTGLYKRDRDEVFDADGYYHTGDAGYFDAGGHLFFKGRLGEMIKTGGANVTPQEVERVLEAYAEVKSAHVVGIPDPERGQLVAAAVVLKPGAEANGPELRSRVKTELSAYKVPRHVFVLPNAALPFTDTGKLDKRRLGVLLAEHAAAEENSE